MNKPIVSTYDCNKKKINNLLCFNVESLTNNVSFGLTLYVYNFIFIKLNLVSLTTSR